LIMSMSFMDCHDTSVLKSKVERSSGEAPNR